MSKLSGRELLQILAGVNLYSLVNGYTDALMYSKEWNYDISSVHGPSHWSDAFSQCSGEQQSPIDIDSSNVWYNSKLTQFAMPEYESIPKGAHWELWNMGYAGLCNLLRVLEEVVRITLEGDYFLSDGSLPSAFKAMYLEFHFGETDYVGSEHSLNGAKFPMEIQIVHYNTKYSSFDTAVTEPDGIAILSYFAKLSKRNNRAFNQVINNLDKIAEKGSHVPLRPIPLLSLFPGNLNNYYRYSGSLTVPPCSQSVTWTVFEDTTGMSAEQLQYFRRVSDPQFIPRRTEKDALNASATETWYLAGNYRPQQARGQRTVYTSDVELSTFLTAPLGSPISFTLALLLGILIMLTVIHYRQPNESDCDVFIEEESVLDYHVHDE